MVRGKFQKFHSHITGAARCRVELDYALLSPYYRAHTQVTNSVYMRVHHQGRVDEFGRRHATKYCLER